MASDHRVDGGGERDPAAERLVARLLQLLRGWGARPQPRGVAGPLRISSRMASRPASKAVISRCVCSSNRLAALVHPFAARAPGRRSANVLGAPGELVATLGQHLARLRGPCAEPGAAPSAPPTTPPRKRPAQVSAASFRSSAMVASFDSRSHPAPRTRRRRGECPPPDRRPGPRGRAPPARPPAGSRRRRPLCTCSVTSPIRSTSRRVSRVRSREVVGEAVDLSDERAKLLLDDLEHRGGVPERRAGREDRAPRARP